MRRTFRRGHRAFLPNVPPLLQRANQLMANGDYAGAAGAFEQLARAAEGRRGPRAPFFHLQSGRARILAGENAAGVKSFKRALDLFAERGQFPRLQQAGLRVTGELNERGLTKEAAEIENWIKALLPPGSAGMFAPDPQTEKRPGLPTHCPACGAPLRPDEVEWLDEGSAVCVYCGSPVRGE